MDAVLVRLPESVGRGPKRDEEVQLLVYIDVEERLQALDEPLTEVADLLHRKGALEALFGGVFEVEVNEEGLRLTLAWLFYEGPGRELFHEEVVVHKLQKLRIVIVRHEPLSASWGHARH